MHSYQLSSIRTNILRKTDMMMAMMMAMMMVTTIRMVRMTIRMVRVIIRMRRVIIMMTIMVKNMTKTEKLPKTLMYTRSYWKDMRQVTSLP